MKYVFILLLALLMFGCYDDDLVIIEDEDINLHNESELTHLLRGISSHNTVYDQLLDGSLCFSIEFPYQLKQDNGNIINVKNKEELSNFIANNNQEFDFLYPLNIKTADYESHKINHKRQHKELLEKCNQGEFFKDHIDCASLIYPIQLAVSDTQKLRFEKIEFNNSEELFNYLNNITSDIRFKIEYPLDLIILEDKHLESYNNLELETIIKDIKFMRCSVIE